MFAPSKISLNKREVRDRLYDDVFELIPRTRTFGILAGRAPKEEIDCIRWRFHRPLITAFDIDPVAVATANECGVQSVLGNVCYKKPFATTRKTPITPKRASDQETPTDDKQADARETPKIMEQANFRETPNEEERAKERETPIEKERAKLYETTTGDKRTFDFFNLDLTGHLSTKKRAIQNVAKRALKAMSVFVSFGSGYADNEAALAIEAVELATMSESSNEKERAVHIETPEGEERATPSESSNGKERAVCIETPEGEEQATLIKTPNERERKIPDTQHGRVLLLHNIVCEVRHEVQIRRVYVYRGNRLMMLGVLFVFAKRVITELPPFCPAHEANSTEREYRLTSLGVSGRQLKRRLRNGRRNQGQRDNHRLQVSQSRGGIHPEEASQRSEVTRNLQASQRTKDTR